MEILSRKNKSNVVNFPLSVPPEIHGEADIFGVLAHFFSLSEEERFRAGIYIGNEGQEWINRSSLVIPPYEED